MNRDLLRKTLNTNFDSIKALSRPLGDYLSQLSADRPPRRRGRARVMKDHTVTNRIKFMLSKVEGLRKISNQKS